MLTVTHSNRLEHLASRLAERLAYAPDQSKLLSGDIVLVQNSGMARWLNLRIAAETGIAANISFRFPGSFIWQLCHRLVPNSPEQDRYARSVLTWRITKLLNEPVLLTDPRIKPLAAYLRGQSEIDRDDPIRQIEIARRIADQLDQLQIYRPDWLIDWQNDLNPVADDPNSEWQKIIWQNLCETDCNHRVALLESLFERITASPDELPERISLIGIATLPPLYLRVLAKLAEVIDVEMLLINPCRHYWGDIVAERDIARRDPALDPAAAYLEVGNRLLASLGKPGRDFIDLVQELPCQSHELFVESTAPSILATLQNDILDLHDRGADGELTRLSDDDRSVQFHSCHSARRELEVLRDQLLWLFEHDPSLQPADVVVMTPNIETYAPLIDAIFDSSSLNQTIAFSIADRQVRTTNDALDTLLRVLDLPTSRFELSEVLGVLDDLMVRQRFQIEADEMGRIQHWLNATKVRWAVDAADRASLGLPAESAHTWREGLERLLIGCGLAQTPNAIYQTLLPFSDIEGADTASLGRFLRFFSVLENLRDWDRYPQPMSVWTAHTRDLIERLFLAETPAQSAELQVLWAALNELKQQCELADHHSPLSFAEFRSAFDETLTQSSASGMASGFFTGGITFCTLVPMRAIPFRVVCLIGMNGDSFPRAAPPNDFDLLTQSYRKGDSSRRHDDRFLFLEALLSARDHLYISYIGRSLRDNSSLPPSVLVSELVEVIDRGYTSADSQTPASEQLIQQHLLTAYSPQYFSADPRWFSYDQSMAEISTQLRQRGETFAAQQAPFFATALPDLDAEARVLTLEQLMEFAKRPIEYLLRHRLGIRFDTTEETTQNTEPFALDNLEQFLLQQSVLQRRLAGQNYDEVFSFCQRSGELPQARIGQSVFKKSWRTIDPLFETIHECAAQHQQHLEFDLSINAWRITGTLTGLGPTGRLSFRAGKINETQRLQCWLQHLILCVLAPPKTLQNTRLVGTDGERFYDEVENPTGILETVLTDYWHGMHQPLPLIPKPAFKYCEALASKPEDLAAAQNKARSAWAGGNQPSFDANNPYHRLVFGDMQPLDEHFFACAQRWINPLLEHESQPK